MKCRDKILRRPDFSPLHAKIEHDKKKYKGALNAGSRRDSHCYRPCKHIVVIISHRSGIQASFVIFLFDHEKKMSNLAHR